MQSGVTQGDRTGITPYPLAEQIVSLETVMHRIGEIMQPIASGAIDRSHIRGDLYDLVAAGTTSRRSDDQITIFKNGGGAHLDLMMASYVVDAVNA